MVRIADMENLREAFLRSAKGKWHRKTVVDFSEHLDENLMAICRQMLSCEGFSFGNYHFFTIYDPKRRTICAASFPERVAFHAMMRVCHPVFDDYQIYDSYASRNGKGTYKALGRAQALCRKHRWFAKLDVCKYFDSIDHQVLMRQLCRLFKDEQLLMGFRELIGGYEASDGKGLPIGNLTSQYFANHYLAVADRYAKERLHVAGMVRYMDDILLFADGKDELKEMVARHTAFLESELKLAVHQPILNKTCSGVPFLGYVVYADRLRLNSQSKRRFRHKMANLTGWLNDGLIDERAYSSHAQCLLSFIDKADSMAFKRKMEQTSGVYS